MNHKALNPVIIPLLYLSLVLLILPFTYQAIYGLTSLLTLTVPQGVLTLISIFLGGLIALCVYDLLGDSQDFLVLLKLFKNWLKDCKQTAKRYILFLRHRHIIKPHLKKIVNDYKSTPNLLKEDWKYHCFEEVLLDYGVLMFPETNLVKHAAKKDLVYVEGYTIFNETNTSLKICSHAWMATSNPSKALDVINREPGICYFGVPFSRQWITKTLQDRKQRGEKECLIFDVGTPEGLHILKYGLPEEAILMNNK
ncbi:hypothetical protein PCC7424_4018 [Gloeothece citriformis PCC 7424]|uniref:Uncharacterized protein n=1 Tax=Gloeothece citriformis (strain PCC 7424) TaxID=65393 RepID=B7KL20_GLOC7|nr:hypothetical protein [Gloeothece citriformis]ACK72392.1 hypothetical protein PCC7424_4018 [Gloeothece citriformis PCC 7424]